MSNLKITQCKREGQVNRMSDDLISKKAVIVLIDKLGYINVSSRDDFNANLRMEKVRQEVVKLPTAFDKEKVIEELKQGTEDSRKTWNRFGGEDAIGEMNAYIRAIEIVDKGGIEQ